MTYDLDLQLFAQPEDEGRTEQPTHRKLHRARQRGTVAHSAELSASLVTLVTVFVFSLLAYFVFTQSCNLIRHNFISLYSLQTDSLANLLLTNFIVFIKITLPILGTAVIIALISEIAQVGLHFSFYSLRFDTSRIKIDIARLFTRLLPVSVRSIFEYAKTLFKVIIISYFAYDVLAKNYTQLLLLAECSFFDALSIIANLAFKLCITVAIILFTMSLLDYLIARREHRRSLMMSRHELLEELRQTEGDPVIRARLRETQRRRARRRMFYDLLGADVVITNPVHIAVAIKYDPKSMPAPILVAKGKDLLAIRIVEIAKLHDIPIIEK